MSNCRFSKYFRKSSRKIRAKENLVRNVSHIDNQDVSHPNCPVQLAYENCEESIGGNFIGSDSQVHKQSSTDCQEESCLSSSSVDIDTDVHSAGLLRCSGSNNLNVNPDSDNVSDLLGCVMAELESGNGDSVKNLNGFKTNCVKSCSPWMLRRRPGKIYKEIIAEKCKGKKSHYFNNKNIDNHKWLPPRSPYCLIQEDLYHSPWQLLIATIFLTKTQAKKAIPQILKFLERWPTPQALLAAKHEEIVEYLRPLGIQHVRSTLIRKFTVEFLEKQWTYPEELHGIGKYGNDSYRIFCINEWRHVQPDDNKLNLYRNWLTENAQQLGI